jgi:hypothetical protein
MKNMLSAVGGSKRLNRLNSSMHGDGDCDVGEVDGDVEGEGEDGAFKKKKHARVHRPVEP